MNAEENEIFDLYAERDSLNLHCYNMMGKMLDLEFIKEKIQRNNIRKMIIYGGGYLGIQLYRSVNEYLETCIIVDKEGVLIVNCLDIEVENIDYLRKEYKGEYVVITPLRYYQEIKDDLKAIIPEDKLILLGELLKEG